jgi:hypothetical protein
LTRLLETLLAGRGSPGDLAPRVVLVHRRTELTELLERHGTRGQAAFYLRIRGRTIEDLEDRHEAVTSALTAVAAAIPPDWRRGLVERADLPRFLFAPDDLVVVVGQDGLVANVAKYVADQVVIGIDPEPGRNPGVLVPHQPKAAAGLLSAAAGTAQRAASPAARSSRWPRSPTISSCSATASSPTRSRSPGARPPACASPAAASACCASQLGRGTSADDRVLAQQIGGGILPNHIPESAHSVARRIRLGYCESRHWVLSPEIGKETACHRGVSRLT